MGVSSGFDLVRSNLHSGGLHFVVFAICSGENFHKKGG